MELSFLVGSASLQMITLPMLGASTLGVPSRGHNNTGVASDHITQSLYIGRPIE